MVVGPAAHHGQNGAGLGIQSDKSALHQQFIPEVLIELCLPDKHHFYRIFGVDGQVGKLFKLLPVVKQPAVEPLLVFLHGLDHGSFSDGLEPGVQGCVDFQTIAVNVDFQDFVFFFQKAPYMFRKVGSLASLRLFLDSIQILGPVLIINTIGDIALVPHQPQHRVAALQGLLGMMYRRITGWGRQQARQQGSFIHS